MKKVTKLGSKWNNSLNAGTFYWNLNNASSNRNRNISRQLVNAQNTRSNAGRVFYINSVFLNYRAAWQNRQPGNGKLKIRLSCIGRF